MRIALFFVFRNVFLEVQHYFRIGRQDPRSVPVTLLLRHDPIRSHVTEKLFRDLCQNLLGQPEPGGFRVVDSIPEKIPERDELNDVPDRRFPVVRRGQTNLVAVELLHGLEVGIADPDDDDGQGEVGGRHDGGFRLPDVRDDAVRDDEEHKVLGPVLLEAAGNARHVVDSGGKVGGTAELNVGEATPVSFQNSGDPFAVRVGLMAVDEELMGDPAVRRDPGAEAENREELVAVVLLQDLADGLDGEFVLVQSLAA